jgi:hypothetical protein
VPQGTDLLFYEDCTVRSSTTCDIARYADLRVGVVPIINLEWIQKLHRDQRMRGYSQEAVTDTILRRMPDYVSHICPQFSRTHVNFQRVPTVDTSNPFIARYIPTPDESFIVIRFANPKGIDFSYLSEHAARFVHEPAKHDRRAGRQDGPGNGVDLHADDPAVARSQEAGAGGVILRIQERTRTFSWRSQKRFALARHPGESRDPATLNCRGKRRLDSGFRRNDGYRGLN